MSFSYVVENDKILERKLADASRRVNNLRFALGEISRDFFKSNKAHFSLKGSGQYPALSPKYQERKDKLAGRRLPILVGASSSGGESGRLRDSISGTPNNDSILDIQPLSLVMGTKVQHGIFSQNGRPLRKFMFIGPEAPRSAGSAITGRLSRWIKIIETDVLRQIDKAGLDVQTGFRNT